MKTCNQLFILLMAVLLFFSMSANAALITQLGGQVVYDDDLNITWLADANLALTEKFGVSDIYSDGAMTKYTANSWIAAMNAYNGGAGYLGFNDWRLPHLSYPPIPCSGYSCTDGELGHLYYDELGAPSGGPYSSGISEELAKFSNIKGSRYLYDLQWDSDPNNPNNVWGLNFWFGAQGGGSSPYTPAYVWAVRDGSSEISSVPVPAAVWLFGSALVGFGMVGRRSRRNSGDSLLN